MRDEFNRNVTNMVKVENFDIDRFNALCRGEELRVSFEFKFLFSNTYLIEKYFESCSSHDFTNFE